MLEFARHPDRINASQDRRHPCQLGTTSRDLNVHGMHLGKRFSISFYSPRIALFHG